MNEPVRLSYLDIVKRNLEAADRTTFCTRFIYFGEYGDSAEYFQKQVTKIMNYHNAEYTDVPIFGLLIIYPKYFIHLVTAPEEMIFRHLEAMFHEELKFGKVLHLPVQHHVYRPYLTKWYSVITKPPVLLEKLENNELSEIEKHVQNFLIKIYKLCEYILDTKIKTGESTSEILKDIEDKVPEYLPENTVLEYLLNVNSPVFYDLRINYKTFMEIPYINFSSDRVWPAPCNFMPKFSFSEKASGREKDNKEKSTS